MMEAEWHLLPPHPNPLPLERAYVNTAVGSVRTLAARHDRIMGET